MAKVYVVATPIGNLEDVTARALRVLGEVDLILCEDTRTTKKLLDHYKISNKTESYNAHSSDAKHDHILDLLREGSDIAMVSDAGTPTISDPGVKIIELINEAEDLDAEVVSVPGPSALVAALSVAAMKGNEFTFLGFVPHKKGRETLFNEIAESSRVMVMYESVHRILKTLESLADVLQGDREVVVARELTKMHEQVVRGTAAEVHKYFIEHSDKVKGEFVVIVEGK